MTRYQQPWVGAAVALAASVACCQSAGAQIVPRDFIDSVAGRIEAYRRSNEKAIVEDFMGLLALPNVAQSATDMQRNAEHLTRLLRLRGFQTRELSAGGAPYIYGELTTEGATETLVIYAHYDGQPVLEEDWAYPPFTPTLLDAPLQAGGQPIDVATLDGPFDPEWRLYARSAGDDKMPIIALLHALDALEINGIESSVNLKVFLDGEEERGSPTVGALLEEHGDLLEADLMLFCDGPMHQSRRAQLVFGARGITGVDITTYGANRPLHSGHYGNWAPNPIMQLAYLLTSMRDEAGRISIESYYDDVAPLSEAERAAIAAMPDIGGMLQDELSVHTPEGQGRRIEELIALPSANARGLVAGGVGSRGSNIILSTATVSMDFRLVANQAPERVRDLVEAHVAEQGFHIVHEDPTQETLRAHAKVAKLDWRPGTPAFKTALDHPASLRLAAVLRQISPDLILTPTMGGTLPLYDFSSRLTTPIVILPLANHDNNQHAENENLRLQNLWDAILALGVLISSYGLGR